MASSLRLRFQFNYSHRCRETDVLFLDNKTSLKKSLHQSEHLRHLLQNLLSLTSRKTSTVLGMRTRS
jgi:hypothetical protein